MSKRMTRLATLAILFCATGCGNGADQAEARPPGDSLAIDGDTSGNGIAAVAARIADRVGIVTATSNDGSLPAVFVFEEYHNSRIGQLEIAVMLHRLRERHGIRSVGLEGAYQSPDDLDATWFHRLGGAEGQERRENVAVRMLAEGEISSAEALALVFPDQQVYGTEIRELYDRESSHEGSPELGYLLSVAQPLLSQAQIIKANELSLAGKTREALDVVMGADSWTRAQFDTIEAALDGTATGPSCEVMERRLRAIRAEVERRGVAVESGIHEEADSAAAFYRTCQDRSGAMVARVVERASAARTPTAMVIGAAHTEGVMRLLRERGVPYAVLRPIALNPDTGSLTNEQYERKSDRLWARTSPGTLGALLNADGADPGRKPPPVIETATAHGYASLLFSGMVIAEAARDGRGVPADVWSGLRDLPECVIDRASFAVDGYDVIFRATLKKTDGTDAVVWSRVGTQDVAQPGGLEPKLLQARKDIGGGGMIPPTKPPAGSEPASDEGPGDGRRGKVVIARTSPRTLAVFAATREDAMEVGRLSS